MTPFAWQVIVGIAVVGLFGAAVALDQRMRVETSMPAEAAEVVLTISESGLLFGRRALHLLCAPDGVKLFSKARLGGPKLYETSPVSFPGTVILFAKKVGDDRPRKTSAQINTRMTLDEIGWAHTLRSETLPQPDLERFADVVTEETTDFIFVAALERGTSFPITAPRDAARAFVRKCRAH